MSNEARRNPNSTQYAGELPDVALGARVALRVVPSLAFIKHVTELREAGVDGPVTMKDSDKDVVSVIIGQWAVPTRLTQQWPQSELPMAELSRMPLTEFKRLHKENFTANGMAAQANTITIEDEKKIEV